MGGEIDEVGDGDLAVEIQVALFNVGGGLAEVGAELNEVGDGDGAIEVQVADEGVADEDGVDIDGLVVEFGEGVGGVAEEAEGV